MWYVVLLTHMLLYLLLIKKIGHHSNILSSQNVKLNGFFWIVYFITVAQAHSFEPSLALMLPLALVVLAIVLISLAACIRKEPMLQIRKLFMKQGGRTKPTYLLKFTCIADGRYCLFNVNCLFSKLSPGSGLFPASLSEMEQQHQGGNTQEELMPMNRVTPPRLLICYSSNDGPAHVKAVIQLGAFIQKHMATQVPFVGLFHFATDIYEINNTILFLLSGVSGSVGLSKCCTGRKHGLALPADSRK